MTGDLLVLLGGAGQVDRVRAGVFRPHEYFTTRPPEQLTGRAAELLTAELPGTSFRYPARL